MDEKKQMTQNREGANTQRAFWGTIMLEGILLLVYAYAFMFVFRNTTHTPITNIATAIFLFAFAMTMVGFVLTIRNRREAGLQFSFYTLLALTLAAVSLFQGRALSLSFSILVVSAMGFGWLFPRQSRRLYLTAAAATLMLIWVVEWINPVWRQPMEMAQIGPLGAVVFVVIFAIILLRQSLDTITRQLRSFSLRAKFLVSVIGITGLSVAIFGFFALYRVQQSQTSWSGELQSTVQQQSRQQAIDTAQIQAHTADQTLSQITYAIKQLANYRATLYADSDLFGPGNYWDGNTKLVLRSGGQHGNSSSDPASVFIPNLVTLNQSLITDLNASMYLDFSAPAVLKASPNVVALYYISANNFTVYYPNIDLANNVPPDFDPLTQPFYTIATPANNPERKAMWTEPYQDPAGTGLIVTNAVPVYDQNGRFRGVMAADIQLSKISEQISTVKIGESGFAFLIDPTGHIISMPDAGYKLFDIQQESVPINESPKTTLLEQGSADLQDIARRMTAGEHGLATATIQGAQYYMAYAPLPSIGYSIGLIAPTAELDATYLTAREKIGNETRLTMNLSIFILLVVLLTAAGISVFLSQFISTPLVQLTKVAMEVSKGNLDVKAEAKTTDEIGVLANTFNTMTSQLRETLTTLEERVAERTQSLELAAEVGRSVSQVRDLETMLKDAAEIIRSRFDLYYVQVYLTNPSRTELLLQAGTGTVGAELIGRSHRLPVNTGSINGRAASDKHSVVISDTAASATFRPNPLLPETRSEMAVPLLVGEKVVGVLDMQSRQAGSLSQEILPAFEALAGQLAIAIQNASLLAEAEQAHAEVESQARRLARAGWEDYLDAIHQPEHTGFVFEKNRVIPLEETETSDPPAKANALTVPIAVAGEPLGSLVVEMGGEIQNVQNAELVSIVARQVAQRIESLRLLDSAERYRAEAEQASRRLTREGWQDYIEKTGEARGYMYDLKEVRPLNGDKPDGSAVTLPLKIRDEAIGKLTIQGIEADDRDSLELANAVAERLSLHIENLRQFEETQRGQMELDKRARRLAAVAEISTVSSKELDIDKMLASVVHLTQRKFGLYHAHVFTYNENTEELKIAACGWKEGDSPEGTHGAAVIPIGQEQSLVARAARTRQAVIVNDVHNEPGWLPNPLLPDTASELAVPLVIGDQVLGVLDVQSDHLNAFTEEDANIQTTLASQVSTALQNARSFAKAHQQAERESTLNVISQKIQSATTVEAVLQIAARELGHALGAPLTIAQLGMKEHGN